MYCCILVMSTFVTCLFQRMMIRQKPALRPPMRKVSWVMWRTSAGTLGLEFGWRTGRIFPLCLALLWPLIAAGAACWEPARWCWHRLFFFTLWAEVSGGLMVKLRITARMCSDTDNNLANCDVPFLLIPLSPSLTFCEFLMQTYTGKLVDLSLII